LKIIYISCYSILGGRQANLTQILYTCDALTRKTKTLYLVLFVPLRKIFATKKILEGIDKNLVIKIIPLPFLKIKGIYLLFDILSFLISMPLIFFDFKIYTRNQRFSRWIYSFKKKIFIEIHDLSNNTLNCLKRCKKALFLSNTKRIIKDIKKLDLDRKLIFHPNAAKLAKKVQLENLIKFKSPSIGYVGSNNIGKGINLINNIAKLNPKLNYYLAGHINIENIPNNVHLLGPLNKHQIREMLEKIDLLIAPYQKEIFDNAGNDNSNYISPLKVFEYMASKKPFIVSRLEFTNDFLLEDYDCLMADPSNHNEWLFKIDKLLSDNFLSIRLSNNAYTKYKENYTWEIRADKIIKIIGNGNLIS